MVVLEEGGMLTNGHNQYLQPDYLSPLPTTLDAKKSPLALLAQTCSQIGADSPSKALITPIEKSTKSSSTASNTKSPLQGIKLERTRSSPTDSNKSLAFKPYETNVVSKKSSDDGRPSSKASVHSVSVQDSVNNTSDNNQPDKNSPGDRTPIERKSTSPSVNLHTPNGNSNVFTNNITSSDRKTPGDIEKVSVSPMNNDASPIVRSGMEILSGEHSKDLSAYKLGSAFLSLGGNPFCCPPGIAENPAFRPPFAGASPFSHHHTAATSALLGYPPTTTNNSNPYLSYARVKTPAGGEALVPVCKDPYCSGCQYSMNNLQMMMNTTSSCPSGCTQCDHQKYNLAMALSSMNPMPPPFSYPLISGGRPYVCNWIAGESYCGKRFTTSDELLQHLRTHTSLAGSDQNIASIALLGSPHQQQQQQQHSLLSPSAATLHRTSTNGSYPALPLSPLNARYHPYGKPPTGPLSASLASSPYSAFNALGPYYSPYTIYGQRIGAAVHP